MSALPEIRDLVSRHAGGPTPTGLVLQRTETPTDPMMSMTAPMFALVVQGDKEATLGDHVFAYGAGEYVVCSLELPAVARVRTASPDSPYLVLGLTLRRSLVADLLLDSPVPAGLGAGSATASAPGIAVSRADDDLLDAVVRMLRLLDRSHDLPVLWPGLEREVVWRLLTGEQGATARQIGSADTHVLQITQAIRWIREHSADLFRVEDVARVAGMSVTSLHRHFRAITTMTPIQFQKVVRLQEARSRLLAEPGNVAAVGFAVGYESASQFSREYRRLFGLPPGQDAARLSASRGMLVADL